MFQLAPASLLSTLIVPCLAYNTVNVYFSPSNIVSSSLAPFVGLEAFETYGDLVPQAIVGEPYPFISPAGNEKRDVLMISVDEEEESFKKAILPASFSSIPIRASSLSDIMQKYSSIAEYFYSSVIDQTTPVVIEGAETTISLRILDTSAIAALQSESAAQFFSSLKNAIQFVENEKQGDENEVRFGSFEFRRLKELRDSVDEEIYQMALQSLRALIESASHSHSVAVLLPSSPNAGTIHRRSLQPPPQSPLPIPRPPDNAPVYSTSTCYSTAEICQNSTSSCSSRGSCVAASRAGRTCFVCRCHPAPLSEGGKNISWAGAMCQKVDISSSFSLLVGTVLFLIIIVGGAISLLYSIGTESLPGTLNISANMVHTKKDL